jgi:DNA-binding Lrp family transcriptional regulator
MRAYVLIDTSLDNAGRITEELRKRPGILLADIVNGPHPVIALLEGDDPSTIAQTILFDIRKTEGVTDLTVFLSREEEKNTTVQDSARDFSSSGKS